MSAKATYGEKLMDPRWQKRRLQILERDGWACCACGAADRTLHVHHHYYMGDPWEVPDDALVTLCQSCHESEPAARRDAEADLLEALRERGFLAMEIGALASALTDMPGTERSQALCAALDVLRYPPARIAAISATNNLASSPEEGTASE